MTAVEHADLLPRRLPIVFRALLRCYPAPFRAKFGRELHDVLMSVRDDAREWSRWARVRLDVTLAADLLRGAIGERAAQLVPTRGYGRGIRRRAPQRPPVIDSVINDLRVAVRGMRARRGFAAMVVLTLGIGIGGVTSMWSVVYDVLLRPLPYPHADRLVRVWIDLSARRQFPTKYFSTSGKAFIPWADSARTLEAIAGYYLSLGRTIEGGAYPVRVPTALVTAQYFDVLGAKPVLGRWFAPGEDRVGATDVAVLSYALWQSQFDGASDVVGKVIRVNGTPTTIIGVAPRGLRWLERPDRAEDEPAALYAPWTLEPNDIRGFLQVLALTKPGVSVHQAELELGALAGPIGLKESAAAPPRLVPTRVHIETLGDALYGTVRDRVVLPLVAVLLVLVLACVNVANLFMSRLPARRAEMAMRMAIGATRRRLVQQLLIDALVLSFAAVVLGVGIAYATTRGVATFGPSEIPRLSDVGIDGVALGVSAALGAVCALACGIAPAIFGSRVDLARDLGGVRHRSYGFGRGYGRVIMLGGQLALALVLIAGASLMLRSFGRLSGIDTGLPTSQLIDMQVALPAEQYQRDLGPLKWGGRVVEFRPEWYAFIQEVVRRLERDGRVASVAASVHAPFQGSAQGQGGFEVENSDRSQMPTGDDARFRKNTVSPEYFRTLGITVVAGRVIEDRDGPDSPPVAVINETLARRYWPGQNPVGRRFYDYRPVYEGDSVGFEKALREVVGVVRDVREQDYTEAPRAMWYKPLKQNLGEPGPNSSIRGMQFYLTIRATADVGTVEAIVRRAVRDLDPHAAVFNVWSVDGLLSRYTLQSPRFFTLLFTLFAGFAIVLASAGVFGVLAMAVSQRTHEIGVRIALGATEWAVIRLVVRQVLAAALAGLVVGLALTAQTGHFLRSLLYETAPNDPTAVGAAAFVLFVAAALAAWVPARRAARVNPVEALRAE